MPIGYTTECEKWQIPFREYISQIKVGYAETVDYIKFTTNRGTEFERGRMGDG